MTSPTGFREYEVEVAFMVTAPSHTEAVEALNRSGIRSGELIGEALVDNVIVYGEDE